MARAEAEAVEEKIVMATCSFKSVVGNGQRSCYTSAWYISSRTETAGVEEARELVITRLKTGVGVTRTWDNLFHNATEDVSQNLEEERGDVDRLRAEILKRKA